VTEIFPIALRNPGPYGPTVPQLVDASASTKKYAVKAKIAQVDLDDPTVVFRIQMEIQRADLMWPAVPRLDVKFTGGPNKGKGGTPTPVPGETIDGIEVAGKNVRFRLAVTGRAVNLGLEADPV
jgi:hypothetical protein